MNLHTIGPAIPREMLQMADAWAALGHPGTHDLFYCPETGDFGYWWRNLRDSPRDLSADTRAQWARDTMSRRWFMQDPTPEAASYITIVNEPPRW